MQKVKIQVMRGYKAPWLHFGEKKNKGTYMCTDKGSDNVTF